MNVWMWILGCLAVSFMFSGLEAGLLSINRVRLRHRLKAKDPAAVVLNRLLAHPERLLMTVLVLTNGFNILALTLGVHEAVRRFGEWGYGIAGALALPVWIVGLEMVPKSLFRRLPYRILAMVAGPLRVADLFLSPLHAVVLRISRGLSMRKVKKPRKLFSGREDFKYMTFESERQGSISAEERAMIHAVVDFRNLTAAEICMPLEQTGAVLGSLTLQEARVGTARLGYDRVPVLSDGGQVTGVMDFHELAVTGQWHGRVEMFQRRILRVKPGDSAYGLLRKMRSARQFMAVVREASGRDVGIVLWDDLVRRLFLPATEASHEEGAASGASRR